MIDVFYVLGSGSKWQNNEIRYSLRSLEKYAHNVGQVYVIGEKPSFISDKVKYIKATDIGSPACNHWYKVKRFFVETGIKRACYMMDDIFFIKDVDLENYPYYCSNELKDYKPNDPNVYHRTILNTRKELIKENKPLTNFEIHCPIIYEKDKFESLEKNFFHIKSKYRPFVGVRSYYCNMNGINGVECNDMKIREKHINDWLDRIQSNDCFSISDEVIKLGVGDWIQKEYPNPSKYEKTL